MRLGEGMNLINKSRNFVELMTSYGKCTVLVLVVIVIPAWLRLPIMDHARGQKANAGAMVGERWAVAKGISLFLSPRLSIRIYVLTDGASLL